MKKQLTIYKLHFTSPLHIGSPREDYGISQTTIPSDTMYAALTASLAKLGETIPEKGYLNCTISSLFPFYQKEKDAAVTYFWPRPLVNNLSDKHKDRLKDIKKVCWLTLDAFNLFVQGQDPFQDGDFEMQGAYLIRKGSDFDKEFIKSQVSERVSISDRTMQSDAEPFYMDRVFFREKSGLYFIAEGKMELLDKALKLLALEGIGTDRNVGNGFFEYETDTIDLDIPDNANHILALSSFCPGSKEQLMEMLSSDKATYELQRRGGWITTPPNQSLRKNVVYMLAPCSVLKHYSTNICTLGKIVDLKPEVAEVEHPIWRCGRALFIPINV